MNTAELAAMKHEAYCAHEDACRDAFEAAMRGDRIAAAAKAAEMRRHAAEMTRLANMAETE